MTKLVITAIIVLAPIVLWILKRQPNKPEKLRTKIEELEDELKEVETLSAKALSDGLMAEHHFLNAKCERLCKKLRRLRGRLKANS